MARHRCLNLHQQHTDMRTTLIYLRRLLTPSELDTTEPTCPHHQPTPEVAPAILQNPFGSTPIIRRHHLPYARRWLYSDLSSLAVGPLDDEG